MSRSDSSAARRVLIVSDGKKGPTATQMISFGQPFGDAVDDATYRIIFEKHRPQVADVEKAYAKRRPDILILSRYTSERGSDWIRLARQARIPVVFHIDDDLLAVPEALGEAKFKAYNDPARLKALRDNIEASDLLYVSTAALARRFEEHGLKLPIVAGDIYCSVRPDEIGALVGPASGPVIGYMGTAGHAADLAMVLPAVVDLMEAVPTLLFEVFGTIAMPPELERFGTRVRHLKAVGDYGDFTEFLRSLGWWVGLAPLEDNSFNRCKADTKWVEYSLAGMAVVASDLPVYDRACADGAGVQASTTDQWRDSVDRLIHDPHARRTMIDTAQAKLRQGYRRDQLRDQVLAVIDRAFAITRA